MYYFKMQFPKYLSKSTITYYKVILDLGSSRYYNNNKKANN